MILTSWIDSLTLQNESTTTVYINTLPSLTVPSFGPDQDLRSLEQQDGPLQQEARARASSASTSANPPQSSPHVNQLNYVAPTQRRWLLLAQPKQFRELL